MHRSSLKYKICYITTNWYAPVCTSMHQYAPVCTAVLWSTNFNTLPQIGMHQYALVCTSMHQYAPYLRNGHSRVKIHKFSTSCVISGHSMNKQHTVTQIRQGMPYSGMHQYALVCTGMHRSSLKYKICYITTNWYAPVCTSMHQYAPVCTAVLWSTNFNTLPQIGMHQYALVCTSMHQYAPHIYETGIQGLKYTNLARHA